MDARFRGRPPRVSDQAPSPEQGQDAPATGVAAPELAPTFATGPTLEPGLVEGIAAKATERPELTAGAAFAGGFAFALILKRLAR